MNWDALARDVIALGAPVLGRALAGPAGGVAGDVLAAALGVDPNPSSVATALGTAAPAVRAAVEGAENAHADAVWAASLRAVEAINATMREEARGDAVQRWWRPFVGYVFGLVALGFGASVVLEIARGHYDVVPKTAEFMWFFGLMAAVVGVSAAGRTFEKLRDGGPRR